MAQYDERFFGKRQENALRSARGVVPIVVGLLGPKSVVDVGCALGEWLSVYREHGIEDVVGIDGDYVDTSRLLIDRQCFHARELSRGVALERSFDLASSLEVAEHLPAEAAERFVASLVKLAPVVLFSAAVPFQGGRGHVNEQWPSYWAARFAEHDYVPVDAIRPRIWTNREILAWYRQNTLLYVQRAALSTHGGLSALFEETDPARLDVVLPEFYAKRVDPSTRRLWKMLRRRLTGRLRPTFGRGRAR